MFQIKRDPSSGSFIQCLAKITLMVLSCGLTRMWSVLWQHICPWCVCVCVLHSPYSASLDCAVHRRCCHNTDYVHIKGRDRTITVILAKHCIKLPDDGSLVIRNMLEHF